MPTRRELLRGLLTGGLVAGAAPLAAAREPDSLAWPRTPLDLLNVRLNEHYPMRYNDDGGQRITVWPSPEVSYQLFFSGFIGAPDRTGYTGYWLAYPSQPPPTQPRYFYAMCPFEAKCAEEYRPGATFRLPHHRLDLAAMQQANPEGYFAEVRTLVDQSQKELSVLLWLSRKT